MRLHGVVGRVVVGERADQRGQRLRHVGFRVALERDDLVDLHRALGDRAGFVEAQHVDARERFGAV